jgi:hypothetical protein
VCGCERRFYAGTKAARATKKVVLSYKFKDIAFNLCKVTQGVIRKMQTYSKPAVLPKLVRQSLLHVFIPPSAAAHPKVKRIAEQ